MAINLKSYPFDEPHGQSGFLQARSGVYAILGKHPWEPQYRVLDIGESQSVQERVANHDRAHSWRRHNVPLFCAVFYCNEPDRMRVERELRAVFNPPCGER